MADEVDQTDAREEFLLDKLRRVRRDVSYVPPVGDGRCHTCGEEVVEGRRWCDGDCRDEWENGMRRED
jgi:hypothetical protein